MLTLILFATIPIGLLWWSGHQRLKREEAERTAWLERIRAAESWVNNLDQLPLVTATRLTLQRGEQCYYAGAAEWWEFRKRTKRMTYHGPVASVQLMKGLRYRVGSITPSIESESVLVQIDAGTLYITDQRLFFDGNEKNTTLKWGSVAAIAAFNGGFEVERQTGKSPFLKLSEKPERAAAIASRAKLAH